MAKQTKEIKITIKDGSISFSVKGLSPIEALGLLRLYEQKQSIRILKDFKDQ